MIGCIEERVDRCDCHSLLRLRYLHDFVASAHFAFLQDAKVESWPSAGCQQCRHPRLVHSDADPIAGNTRLSDFEHGAADPITIADTHNVVEQSFDCEVLPELSVDEIGPF